METIKYMVDDLQTKINEDHIRMMKRFLNINNDEELEEYLKSMKKELRITRIKKYYKVEWQGVDLLMRRNLYKSLYKDLKKGVK